MHILCESPWKDKLKDSLNHHALPEAQAASQPLRLAGDQIGGNYFRWAAEEGVGQGWEGLGGRGGHESGLTEGAT